MFKAMILLTRRDELSLEEFHRWWLEQHRPMALGLPKLRRMVINLVDEASEPGVDGISGKAVAADTLAHVTARVRLLVTEHE